LTRPSDHAVAAFRLRQARLGFSYPHVGCTERSAPPAGYRRGVLRTAIGRGQGDFAAARTAIQNWQQFPNWVSLDPPAAPARAGSAVAVLARVCGLWVWNACRIVAVEDNPGRFSLTYGTLPGHAMLGEERFAVELCADGTVAYEILADSRPATVLQHLSLPLVRVWQGAFRRDSARNMEAAVREHRIVPANSAAERN
jgi:uncharacterized protein (UPF0548 family)